MLALAIIPMVILGALGIHGANLVNETADELATTSTEMEETSSELSGTSNDVTDVSNELESNADTLEASVTELKKASDKIHEATNNTEKTIADVKTTLENSTSEGLEQQIRHSLMERTTDKVAYYDEILGRIKADVEATVQFSKYVYDGPNQGDIGMNLLMPWVESSKTYGNATINATLQNESNKLMLIGQLLKGLVDNNPLLSLGYVGTETSITVFHNEAIVDIIWGIEGFEVTGRPWYTQARSANATIWTEAYVDANTKELVTTCASPIILDNGDMVGVVGFDILLDTLQNDVLKIDMGESSYAYLIDGSGHILVRPDLQQGGAQWDETFKTEDMKSTNNSELNAITTKMIAGGSDIELIDYEGGPKYIAYAPVKNTGWSLAIVVSVDEITEPAKKVAETVSIEFEKVLNDTTKLKESANEMDSNADSIGSVSNSISEDANDLKTSANALQTGSNTVQDDSTNLKEGTTDIKDATSIFQLSFILIVLGTIVLAFVVATFIARTITRPIRQLTEISEKVSTEGDFRVTVVIDSNDEIGELAQSFDRMITSLRVAMETFGADLGMEDESECEEEEPKPGLSKMNRSSKDSSSEKKKSGKKKNGSKKSGSTGANGSSKESSSKKKKSKGRRK